MPRQGSAEGFAAHMRTLIAFVLLLTAVATFGQDSPKDDLLHGPANTYEELEIRPGIILGVRYDAGGTTSTMNIAPSWRPDGLRWQESTIPRETVESILNQLLPPEIYGKPIRSYLSCFSCPCHGNRELKGATIWISECTIPTDEVVEVAIEFGPNRSSFHSWVDGASGRFSGDALATPNQDARTKMEIEVTQQDVPKELEIEFKPTMMGELLDEDGQHLGFSRYTASDGTQLTALYNWFFGAQGAQEYFDKQLAKAAEVIDRQKKQNSAGKVVGERAQILKRLGPDKTLPAVLWTDGLTFHEIYSLSLSSILQLEKGYRYTVPDHIR